MSHKSAQNTARDCHLIVEKHYQLSLQAEAERERLRHEMVIWNRERERERKELAQAWRARHGY